MKKTLTYCFGSLLCMMTLASCQNGGSCCGQAATDVDLTGRLYPKVKTPTKSLVIACRVSSTATANRRSM